MRKLIATLTVMLLLVSLLSTPMQGADKRVNGAAAYGFLTVGESWADFTGAPGVTFVFDTIGPGTGICLALVNNNTTNSRTVNLKAAQTSALSVTTFTNNQGAWNTIPITPNQTSFTVPAFSGASVDSGTLQVFIRAAGAAHVALTVNNESGTAGGSPDTLTIQYAWSGSSCGAVNAWSVGDVPALATACNSSAGVIAGVAGVRHVASCISVSAQNASSTTASYSTTCSIRDGGVAGNCTTGTSKWNGGISVPATAGSASNITQCGLNISGTAGNSLQVCCDVTPPTGEDCRSSLTGFDQ